MRRKPRADRWFSMLQVADLLKVRQKNPRERRRIARRAIRGLEQRDGRTYLQRFGPGRGKLWVSISALESMLQWEPGTLAGMRAAIDQLGTDVKRHEATLTRHNRDISQLKEFQQRAGQLLADMSAAWGPKGTKKGGPSEAIS